MNLQFRVEIAGRVNQPAKTVGVGNVAEITGDAELAYPIGEVLFPTIVRGQTLKLNNGGNAFAIIGPISGTGRIEVHAGDSTATLDGKAANTYKGNWSIESGGVILAKEPGATAMAGTIRVGGSGLTWTADHQIDDAAEMRVEGEAKLNLCGKTESFAKLDLAPSAIIDAGGGVLSVRELTVGGKSLPAGIYTAGTGWIQDGTYRAPHAWLAGGGSVTVDSRVDVQGAIGSPEAAIGSGNIGNLTGHLKIGYPSSGGDFDIATNGHTFTLDSGDGNAFVWSGSIGGPGNVEFFMGPSSTGYRDTPMLLTGKKPNTTTGTFFVRKGRVQLEKPEGVDAIAGNVSVGGQGFNDCLFWNASHQIKDSATITLLDAMNNRILTDSGRGVGGAMTVKSLTIDGAVLPAGEYTAANAKWIEGKGRVIVKP